MCLCTIASLLFLKCSHSWVSAWDCNAGCGKDVHVILEQIKMMCKCMCCVFQLFQRYLWSHVQNPTNIFRMPTCPKLVEVYQHKTARSNRPENERHAVRSRWASNRLLATGLKHYGRGIHPTILELLCVCPRIAENRWTIVSFSSFGWFLLTVSWKNRPQRKPTPEKAAISGCGISETSPSNYKQEAAGIDSWQLLGQTVHARFNKSAPQPEA